MADIIRYDGTRLMTDEDVDREFLGKLVLLDSREFPNSYFKGYLYAVTDATSEGSRALGEIAVEELDGKGSVLEGCEFRGASYFHVEILSGIESDENEPLHFSGLALELAEEKI